MTTFFLKTKCTKCLKEISVEEFLKHNHRCEKCDDLPNFIEDERCHECRHVKHEGICDEPTTRGEIVYKCECAGEAINGQD